MAGKEIAIHYASGIL